jgi:hypothetical protein
MPLPDGLVDGTAGIVGVRFASRRRGVPSWSDEVEFAEIEAEAAALLADLVGHGHRDSVSERVGPLDDGVRGPRGNCTARDPRRRHTRAMAYPSPWRSGRNLSTTSWLSSHTCGGHLREGKS